MSFAHYLLQVNLYLIVFYGFYKLLLDKETYFMLNRMYLVVSGILSLCIPFIRLEWLTEQKAAQQVYTSVNWDAVLQQATIVTESDSGFNWGALIVYVYCAGILFFLCRLVVNLFLVKKLLKTTKAGSAFSFFSKKVIDQYLPQMEIIDVHEEAHIKQWHTLDILFFEVIGVITWLNPVTYLYKKAIKNIHEFLADEHAAEFQGDKAEYAMLILSKSFGISPNSLTNGFFDKSLIKKRIYMLHKERSKKIAVVKYGIFIPLFAILIVFSSATVRKNEKLISISDQLPLDKPIDLVTEMVIKPSLNFPEVKSTPLVEEKIDGNWKNFYQFLAKSIKYPQKAFDNNLQGNTQIKFIVKNGKVNNLSTNVELGDDCDEEVMKAILSYKDFKKIESGNYAINVDFQLSDFTGEVENKRIITIRGYKNLTKVVILGSKLHGNGVNNDNKVFDFVSIEKQPEFPGGISKFYKYIGGSIKYPTMAQDNNVQGKVFLSFVVEKDGALSDVKVTRGLGSGTDEEAIRVLKESPKWNPGVKDGQLVRVKYNINVNFTLNKDINDNETKVEPKGKISNFYSKPYNNEVAPKIGGENFAGVVILDGIKLKDNNEINTIDPKEIESISILKDQSAVSVYGIKAKSGAIIITTKLNKANNFLNPSIKDLSFDKTINNIMIRERF